MSSKIQALPRERMVMPTEVKLKKKKNGTWVFQMQCLLLGAIAPCMVDENHGIILCIFCIPYYMVYIPSIYV